MADFMCRSLGRLGMLLQQAYLRRDRCTVDNKDIRAIAEAELNLRRFTISSPAIVPFATAADSMKL